MNPCGSRAGINCEAVPPAHPITVMQLMTHTSGLPGGVTQRGEVNTLAEHVAGVHTATLLFEPGTEWNYSNIGVAALGRIIEVVSKQPFEQFIGAARLRSLADEGHHLLRA